MIIFQFPVKSMPIPGASLRTLDLAFLSGYLGFDVTDKQEKTLAQGLGYRRWVDALDLRNTLCGGISYVDETNIKPFSVNDRYDKRDEILGALDEIVAKTDHEPDARISALQEMIAKKWIEGVAMGASMIVDFTTEELMTEAVKYAKRRHPEKVAGKQHA